MHEARQLRTDKAKVQEQLITEENTHRATKAELAFKMREQEQMATEI